LVSLCLLNLGSYFDYSFADIYWYRNYWLYDG
jgi:hypothetical protein